LSGRCAHGGKKIWVFFSSQTTKKLFSFLKPYYLVFRYGLVYSFSPCLPTRLPHGGKKYQKSPRYKYWTQ
jgi:hypothetical protein